MATTRSILNGIEARLRLFNDDCGTKRESRRKTFSSDEDDYLVYLVDEYGECNWKLIASKMLNKNARQCRERYKNYLMPNLSKSPWSKEEDLLLLDLISRFGQCWSKISKSFQARSRVNVKNRGTYLVSKGKVEPVSVPRLMGIEENIEPEWCCCFEFGDEDPLSLFSFDFLF